MFILKLGKLVGGYSNLSIWFKLMQTRANESWISFLENNLPYLSLSFAFPSFHVYILVSLCSSLSLKFHLLFLRYVVLLYSFLVMFIYISMILPSFFSSKKTLFIISCLLETKQIAFNSHRITTCSYRIKNTCRHLAGVDDYALSSLVPSMEFCTLVFSYGKISFVLHPVINNLQGKLSDNCLLNTTRLISFDKATPANNHTLPALLTISTDTSLACLQLPLRSTM